MRYVNSIWRLFSFDISSLNVNLIEATICTLFFFFTKIPKGRSVIYILRLDDKKILKNQANPFAIKICEDKKNYNKKIDTNKHISYTIACQFKLKKLRLLSSQFTSSLKNIFAYSNYIYSKCSIFNNRSFTYSI